MAQSDLRDIIPTNDATETKKLRKQRIPCACKILTMIFLLGLISIGIVVLAIIFTYSGKSLINYVIRPLEEPELLNKTRDFQVNEKNLKSELTKQEWESLTSSSINDTINRIEHENEYVSTNTQMSKLYPSSNTIVNEQKNSSYIESTMPNRQSTLPLSTKIEVQEHIKTTEEHQVTTVDHSISTILFQKDKEITTSKQITSTVPNEIRSSKTKNILLAKYKKSQEDDIINDLLSS